MFCLAHHASSVDKAIFWLEQSAHYEFDPSFNDLAYLYFAYKHDFERAWIYSETGMKFGWFDSLFIRGVLEHVIRKGKMKVKPYKQWDEMIYQYKFEDDIINYNVRYRLQKINQVYRIFFR